MAHTFWHKDLDHEEKLNLKGGRMKNLKITHRRPFPKNKLRYGRPISLFGDSDKDGVPNVFDCKPRNKRRQDVTAPYPTANPVTDMFGRQEQARLARDYQRRLDELRRQEEERLRELARLSNVTVVDKTQHHWNTSWNFFTPSGELISAGTKDEAITRATTPTAPTTTAAKPPAPTGGTDKVVIVYPKQSLTTKIAKAVSTIIRPSSLFRKK